MAAPPGNKFAAGPHRPSAKMQLWAQLQDYVMGDGLERYLDELTKADPETFMKHYITILEFVRPRLQRQQVEVSTDQTRSIKLNFGVAKLLTGGGEESETLPSGD